MQRVAFLSRTKLHDALIADVGDQTFENLATQSLAGHFAAAEENGRLHLIAFAEEAQHVVLLRLIVVIVHVNAELHFLDDDVVLFLLGLALTLFLLILVFAEVHDAAHRRLRRRGDFYQIQISFAGDFERFEGGHNTQLVSCVINYAYFADADALVGADKTFVDTVLLILLPYARSIAWLLSSTLRLACTHGATSHDFRGSFRTKQTGHLSGGPFKHGCEM